MPLAARAAVATRTAASRVAERDQRHQGERMAARQRVSRRLGAAHRPVGTLGNRVARDATRASTCVGAQHTIELHGTHCRVSSMAGKLRM